MRQCTWHSNSSRGGIALIHRKNDDIISIVSPDARVGFQVCEPAGMQACRAHATVISLRIAGDADVISAFKPRFSIVRAYNAVRDACLSLIGIVSIGTSV